MSISMTEKNRRYYAKVKKDPEKMALRAEKKRKPEYVERNRQRSLERYHELQRQGKYERRERMIEYFKLGAPLTHSQRLEDAIGAAMDETARIWEARQGMQQ